MADEVNRRPRRRVPLVARLLLVLLFWCVAIMFLSGHRLLITVLGEDYYPVWLQNAACVCYLVITWALVVYSRPIGFFALYGLLVVLFLLNLIVFLGDIWAARQRYFP